MERSCADVNSPVNESAELTQGALWLIHYSGLLKLGGAWKSHVDTVYVGEWSLPSRGCYTSPMYNFRGRVKEQGFMEITNNINKITFLFLFTLNYGCL